VRGDLDWIVMKALEKDRRRRYDTASALAQDLERHLNHEAVSADRPRPAIDSASSSGDTGWARVWSAR
jgi:hypothetical protein